ncbi:MAG: hypothetical protein LIO65_06505 [Odoribacter sp.]|nr:hypothetical protein [Odoribacter sp.]
MKKIKTILAFLFAAIFIMSCVKEDYDSWDCEPEPGPGTGEGDNPVIIVNFDWSFVYERRDVELVEVIITEEDDDSTTTEMYVEHNGTEVELVPDMYEFVGDDIHEHEQIMVQRCTLTLAQNPDGTYIEPENFTGGSIEAQIYDIDET